MKAEMLAACLRRRTSSGMQTSLFPCPILASPLRSDTRLESKFLSHGLIRKSLHRRTFIEPSQSHRNFV